MRKSPKQSKTKKCFQQIHEMLVGLLEVFKSFRNFDHSIAQTFAPVNLKILHVSLSNTLELGGLLQAINVLLGWMGFKKILCKNYLISITALCVFWKILKTKEM